MARRDERMNLAGSQLGLAKAHERRRGARVKVDAVAYLTVDRFNGGILLDLSKGGMRISVANPLSKAATIQFSLGSEEHQVVNGSGRVAWLSESGRSAGVEFVRLPAASRDRIWEWVEGKNRPAEGDNGHGRQAAGDREPPAVREQIPDSVAETKAAGTEDSAAPEATAATGDEEAAGERPLQSPQKQQTPSRRTLFAPPAPRPEALPGQEEPPPAEERGPGYQLPETPLFFLPRKRESDDVSPRGLAEETQPYSGNGEKPAGKDNSEDVAAFRLAIASGAESEDRKVGKGRAFRKILGAVAILATLVALGAGVILYYPNTLSSLKSFKWMAGPQAIEPSAKAPRLRRFMRRGANARTPARNERGSRPVRDVGTFYAPRATTPHFPVEMTDASNQHWMATVTSQRMVPAQARPMTAANGSGPSQLGQMGGLRVDGALVEEGSVAPSFAPLHLEGLTPETKSVVVEAVIGKDGGVENVRLISTPSSRLAQALVDAVKQWRYQPVYQDGQPIEFTTRITFNFSLPNQQP